MISAINLTFHSTLIGMAVGMEKLRLIGGNCEEKSFEHVDS